MPSYAPNWMPPPIPLAFEFAIRSTCPPAPTTLVAMYMSAPDTSDIAPEIPAGVVRLKGAASVRVVPPVSCRVFTVVKASGWV